MISELLRNKKVLEIGPFLKPFIRGDNVKYLDVMNLDDLKERAKKINFHYNPNYIPSQIDYVISNEDYSVINEKFDAVFSSHLIEHQVDLIHHLQQVEGLLEENDSYFLCIPDKRYCFDHFKPCTPI